MIWPFRSYLPVPLPEVKELEDEDTERPEEVDDEEDEDEEDTIVDPNLWEAYCGSGDDMTTYRCPVPNGWLVCNDKSYTICFFKDANHVWRWPPPV